MQSKIKTIPKYKQPIFEIIEINDKVRLYLTINRFGINADNPQRKRSAIINVIRIEPLNDDEHGAYIVKLLREHPQELSDFMYELREEYLCKHYRKNRYDISYQYRKDLDCWSFEVFMKQ